MIYLGIKFALDIGIASVGWAVVDDSYRIIDLGSRLFESADASKNTDRREQRGRRRNIRRKQHRVEQFTDLWVSHFKETPTDNAINIVLLRNQGLKEQLTHKELFSVLKYYMKHRGISYLEDSIDEDSGSSYAASISANEKLLENKFPCQIQEDRLKKYGQYRAEIIDSREESTKHLSNIFTISAYVKEVTALLKTQSQFYKKINAAFIHKYIEILSNKRKYYDGPGNEQSRSDYGRYTTDINNETGEFITLPNLFDKLIGKCTIFPTERRASSASFTAQLFNALNDLNNLTVNGRKLNQAEKEVIINNMILKKTVNVRKIIKNAIGEDIRTLKGARVDTKDKELFHKFDLYNKMARAMEKDELDITHFSHEQFDELANMLTLNTDMESIVNSSKELSFEIDQKTLLFLTQFRKSNGSHFNKWHSLSLKAMKELNPILLEQAKNQMQILSELGYLKTGDDLFKNYAKIPTKLITNELYNPVVKRSVAQSIKVVNALIDTYGPPNDIIVEMARDKNEDDQKKRIRNNQGKYEKELEKIISEIKRDYNIEITDSNFHNNKMLKTKLRLWKEQEGRCLYSGKIIAINDLLYSKEFFEIDHIIPISISFDDSRSNKVLVYREENQLKGNRTPFMYLHGINRDWNYLKYEATVKQLYKSKTISLKKMQLLLFMENITKQEVVQGFINRNLNDTRYASRVVLNSLQSYMRANEKDTKIKVIRGSFTSQLRNKLHLPKEREEDYSHHAIDAAIMCYSQMGLNDYKFETSAAIDYETGEVLNEALLKTFSANKLYEDKLFYENIKLVKSNLELAKSYVKYSYRTDKKVNRQIANETIRGTRIKNDGKTYKIGKIKDIYSKDGWEQFKKRITEKNGKSKLKEFLMYHHDPQTFEILLKIVDQFSDQENPFAAYKIEYGEAIRKYSKKNNGPFIKSLKYYDGEVGAHIDISNKYGHNKGTKKVILDSLKPYRTDVYYNVLSENYHIAGIKYANYKYVNGHYMMDKEQYDSILKQEKILTDEETYADLEAKGIEFLFSLYKNDIISYEKNGDFFTERFLSRTMPKKLNYIETKPLEKNNFPKRNLIGLSKSKQITKINTDILGNMHFTNKEKFKLY